MNRSLLCLFIIIQVCVTGKEKIWACGLFVYDFSARGTALAEPLAFLFSLENKKEKKGGMDGHEKPKPSYCTEDTIKRFCLLFTCR